MSIQGAFYMNEYDELKQFDTIEEMNETIKAVRYHFADELNVTAVAVLDFISQHACKVLGVAKLKVESIAKAIGKSVRTINYATKRLHDLSIVNKVETQRKVRGGAGANVYVINANSIAEKQQIAEGLQGDCRADIAGGEVSETPTESKAEAVKMENETLDSIKPLPKTLNKTLKDFEKNNNHNLVKDIELEEKPLFADTNDFLRIAYAGLTNVEGNQITKRLVTAFKKSELSMSTKWTLQEYCAQNKEFARQLAERVRICLVKYRNGDIDKTLYGYIYTAAVEYFKQHLAIVEGTLTESSQEVDLIESPIAQSILNAKIEHPIAYTAPLHNPIEINNDDLPW
ncbi:helix-turn-helix domain-containing protein [Bacillus cereus]|uniref:helix-turn-helix domain-containing protein n=1 Tax=Bacillus cereus TaxID=1396 RepID=UPI000BECBA72|nr:helix-turn-helix domain-containing protein [Bacillus cereus]PED33863.1 helix-turn-helix domain-containing protein [Bacillus cereus]PEE52050.1 helix-turn-helix domain-containing protein [Bacillus cereus]PFL90896.1 helix-turn-helix domain-containing protein [Bacillus cereus]PFV69473.1 helix-turn-helix domain-containing protein [Bacillus cereus]PGS34933.1 helix-turn-helix domain-containing protein [Bacillus cereus]